MLLEIREEITPERMKGLSQSKNSKMDNVEEMDKYLEKYNFPKLD